MRYIPAPRLLAQRAGSTSRTLAATAIWALVAIVAAVETAKRDHGGFFYADDFIGIQLPGNAVAHALEPYGGHLSYSAATIWFSWLEVFGASSYTPFLWLAIAITSATSLMLLVAVRAVWGITVGVAASIWLLTLGPAFHNQLWDQASLSQIAAIAVMGLALVSYYRWRSTALGVAIALVGFGVGGLGTGVAVALLALLLMARRFRWASIVFIGMCVATLIAKGSAEGVARPGMMSIRNVASIPFYVLTALQETIRQSLAITDAIAGVFTVTGLLVFAIAIPIALRNHTSFASRTLIATLTYLATTWTLAAFVRGILEEVAAPRYIGVTGPLLILAILSGAKVLQESGLFTSPSTRALGLVGRPSIVFVAILVFAAVANLPTWLQARENTNYLGLMNIARLGAMHAGAAWIRPDFVPDGEGLMYVRQDTIEAAWAHRGTPNFSASAIAAGEFGPASMTTFLQTALAAGLVTQTVSRQSTGTCMKSVTVNTAGTSSVRYSRDAAPTIQALNSSQLPIVTFSKPGALHFRPLDGVNTYTVSTETGCLEALDS